MKDVIVIYSKENKSFVKKLVSKLETDNVSCMVSPKDFRQDEKESVINAIQESKLMVLLVDKNSRTNSEIRQVIQLALDNNLEIIPFVTDKIEPDLFSTYFFHTISWIDAFQDSFEEAYELLLEAIHDYNGGKKTTTKKNVKKDIGKEKVKPIIYVIIAAAVLAIFYVIYRGVSSDENSEILIGQWDFSDYHDNLPRSHQDSIAMIQNLQNMRKTMKLIFNEDHSFKRLGYQQEPNSGTWELNPERTVLYLAAEGSDKKDIINIEKLNEKDLTIFVNEKVDTFQVTTRISFTKQIVP